MELQPRDRLPVRPRVDGLHLERAQQGFEVRERLLVVPRLRWTTRRCACARRWALEALGEALAHPRCGAGLERQGEQLLALLFGERAFTLREAKQSPGALVGVREALRQEPRRCEFSAREVRREGRELAEPLLVTPKGQLLEERVGVELGELAEQLPRGERQGPPGGAVLCFAGEAAHHASGDAARSHRTSELAEVAQMEQRPSTREQARDHASPLGRGERREQVLRAGGTMTDRVLDPTRALDQVGVGLLTQRRGELADPPQRR